MRPLTIDFAKNRIVMTRAFARKASDPSTKEYRELKDTMETFPTFSVEHHTIKKCSGKESYKGLNYSFMYYYINTYVEESKREKAMADLEEQDFVTDEGATGKKVPKMVLEANYRSPSFTGSIAERLLSSGCRYIPGQQWLLGQAVSGYALMTGEVPDAKAMAETISL